jgi:hypothetical protein
MSEMGRPWRNDGNQGEVPADPPMGKLELSLRQVKSTMEGALV